MRAGEAVFVDSGAWIALALTRDPLHGRARRGLGLDHGCRREDHHVGSRRARNLHLPRAERHSRRRARVEGLARDGGPFACAPLLRGDPEARVEDASTDRSPQAVGGGRHELRADGTCTHPMGVRVRPPLCHCRLPADRLSGHGWSPWRVPFLEPVRPVDDDGDRCGGGWRSETVDSMLSRLRRRRASRRRVNQCTLVDLDSSCQHACACALVALLSAGCLDSRPAPPETRLLGDWDYYRHARSCAERRVRGAPAHGRRPLRRSVGSRAPG